MEGKEQRVGGRKAIHPQFQRNGDGGGGGGGGGEEGGGTSTLQPLPSNCTKILLVSTNT